MTAWTRDPHDPRWEWVAVKGRLFCSMVGPNPTYTKEEPGPSAKLWIETPERVALWISLMLEPN